MVINVPRVRDGSSVDTANKTGCQLSHLGCTDRETGWDTQRTDELKYLGEEIGVLRSVSKVRARPRYNVENLQICYRPTHWILKLSTQMSRDASQRNGARVRTGLAVVVLQALLRSAVVAAHATIGKDSSIKDLQRVGRQFKFNQSEVHLILGIELARWMKNAKSLQIALAMNKHM